MNDLFTQSACLVGWSVAPLLVCLFLCFQFSSRKFAIILAFSGPLSTARATMSAALSCYLTALSTAGAKISWFNKIWILAFWDLHYFAYLSF